MTTVRKHTHSVISTLDDREPSETNHQYIVSNFHPDLVPMHSQIINFQNGPTETSVNGLHNEDLLHIVRHRLESFQAGEFSCVENAMALEHVRGAIIKLEMRTADRRERGVEGRLTP